MKESLEQHVYQVQQTRNEEKARRTSNQPGAEDNTEMAMENKGQLTKLFEEIIYNSGYYYLTISLPQEKNTALSRLVKGTGICIRKGN